MAERDKDRWRRRHRTTHVAAIDLGASSGRVIVGAYSTDEGIQLTEVHRFDNGPVHDGNSLRWDLDALLREIKAGIAVACQRYPIAAIGIDAWGVDYGLIDEQGNVLEGPFHYRDSRTAGLSARLREQGKLEGLYALTGTQVMDINTLYQLVTHLRDKPELKNRPLKMLPMPDLLAYLLTGSIGTEDSIASTTQLVDAQAGSWSEHVLERFGIPSTWLPPIYPSGSDAGAIEVHQEAAEERGTARSIPLIRVCEHDTASAVASIPLDEGLFISCGTWSLVGTPLPSPLLTDEAESLNITNERGADRATLLLENCTGLWIAQELRHQMTEEAEDPSLVPSWIEIARLANSAPSYATLIDTDAAIFSSPGSMRENIAQFAKRTGQAIPSSTGELFRCVYESLALRYRRAIQDIERLTGRTFDKIHIIGGGAQNRFICQAVANAAQLPVIAGPSEATALGNVLIQLVALDVFPDLESAQQMVAASVETVRYEPGEPPSSEAVKRYEAITAAGSTKACDLDDQQTTQ